MAKDEVDERCFITLVQTKQGRLLGLEPKLKLRCLQGSGYRNYRWKTVTDPDIIAEHMKSMSLPFSEEDLNLDRSSKVLAEDYKVAKEYMGKIYAPHITLWQNYWVAVKDGSAFSLMEKMKVWNLVKFIFRIHC
jgi:hypothetical protein